MILKRLNDKIKVYKDKHKKQLLLPNPKSEDPDTLIWDLSNANQRKNFLSIKDNLWIEGYAVSKNSGDTGLQLTYRPIKPLSGDTLQDIIDTMKMTVVKVEVNVDETKDKKTHKILSVLDAGKSSNDPKTGKEHFVTVKGTGNVSLKAKVIPDDQAIKNLIIWETDNRSISLVGNKEKVSFSRNTTTGEKVPLKIKIYNKLFWEGYGWIVWATCVSNHKPLKFVIGSSTSNIEADWEFIWTIYPSSIITDKDRPNLEGPNSTSPPNGEKRHVISNNPLSGGADKKWDVSRQVRFKVINPHLYTKSQLPSVLGTFYDNQPVSIDIPDNFPIDPVEGNDDSHTGDEDNDPYNPPNIGKVISKDTPSAPMKASTGSLNDTYEERYHFREFVRLELGGVWYRISDFYLWRVHYKYIKNSTGNWIDNGSDQAQDNNGF